MVRVTSAATDVTPLAMTENIVMHLFTKIKSGLSDKRGRRALILALACLPVAGAVSWSAVSSISLQRQAVAVRDAQRSADVAILASLAKPAVSGQTLLAGAPVIIHPTFSQVIVFSADGIVCNDPPRRPECPGQALDFGGADAKCVTDLRGLSAVGVRPLLDPSGIGASLDGRGIMFGMHNSGYYIHVSPGNRIEVGACWPERGAAIKAKR